MAPLVLTLVQALFLVLLYLFIARAVRTVLKDLRPASAVAAAPTPAGASRREGHPSRRGQPDERRRPPGELVVHVPGGRPRVLRLGSSDVTFGRNEMSTVMLTDSYASERHARVFPHDDQWLVEDVGSTNGTFLNQVQVTRPTPIAAGDQVTIGKTVIEVRK